VALLFDKRPQQNGQPEFKKMFSRSKVIYPGSPPATSQGFGQEYKDADGHLSVIFLVTDKDRDGSRNVGSTLLYGNSALNTDLNFVIQTDECVLQLA